MSKPEADIEPTLRLNSKRKLRLTGKQIERIAQVGMLLAAAVLLYFIILSLTRDLTSFYAGTLRPFAVQYWPNMAAVLVLVVLGFVFYTFRGYKIFLFGIAEMALGVGIGWYAINKAVSGQVSDAIIFLFAALYLNGRAWINISTKVPNLQIDRTEDG